MSREAILLFAVLSASGGCSERPESARARKGPVASATGAILEISDRGGRIEIRADRLDYAGPADPMRFSGNASVSVQSASGKALEARADHLSATRDGARMALAGRVAARFSVAEAVDGGAGF